MYKIDNYDREYTATNKGVMKVIKIALYFGSAILFGQIIL